MTPNPKRRWRPGRSWWLWSGYWLCLFGITHIPLAGRGPLVVQHGDKAIHFGLYFILTWLGGHHLFVSSGRPTITRLVVWGLVYAAYATLDECLQAFVGRSMTLGDWLANLAGIVVGTVWLLFKRRSGPPRASFGGPDDGTDVH